MYCNYSKKDKFNSELTFITPSWFTNPQIKITSDVAESSDTNGAVFYERPYKIMKYDDNENAYGFNWHNEDFFIYSCQVAEKCYLLMLREGATPQEARQVLPLALKTDICMTGFLSDWQHFFDLRLYGITGAPHPDMKALAELAMQEFNAIGLADKLTRSEEQITTLKAQAVETFKKYIG